MRSSTLIISAVLAFVPIVAGAQALPQTCPVATDVYVLDRPEGTYLAVRTNGGNGYGWDFSFDNILVAGSAITVDALPFRLVFYGFIPMPVHVQFLGALHPGEYAILIRPSISSRTCTPISRIHQVAGVANPALPVPAAGSIASWSLSVLILLAGAFGLRRRMRFVHSLFSVGPRSNLV